MSSHEPAAATAYVWLVESGDYEQRGVDLIADSLETAVAAIKTRYGPPYIVAWDELAQHEWEGQSHEEWTLVGHFEQVIHYSTQHVGRFDISRWVVAS